jgi:hypothetical protein
VAAAGNHYFGGAGTNDDDLGGVHLAAQPGAWLQFHALVLFKRSR